MRLKPYLFGFFLLISGLIALNAAERSVEGVVRVGKVVGDVVVENLTTGTRRPLIKGDRLTHDYAIDTAGDGVAILLFANGSTVTVKPNTRFLIETFLHEPFSGQQPDIAELTEEPNSSETKLSIDYGRLVGRVKKLSYDKGSSYQIKTPLGVAGIRGTVYDVYIDPDDVGEGSFGVAEGRAIFEPTFPIAAGTLVKMKLGRSKDFGGTVPVIVMDEMTPEIKEGIEKEIEEIVRMTQGVPIDLDVAGAELVPGVVKVVSLSGNVEVFTESEDDSRPIQNGDSLEEGEGIKADKNGSAVLLFSNGSSVLLKEGSTLRIKEFKQDPRGLKGLNVSDINMEPTSSRLRLKVLKGEILGNVKRLNVKAGSAYMVETPLGKVHITGTSFQITENGQAGGSVGLVTGQASFTPAIPVGDGGKLLLNTSEGIDMLVAMTDMTPEEITDIEADVDVAGADPDEEVLEEEGPLPPIPQADPTTPSGGA